MSAPIENLLEKLHARRSGRGWITKCPAHEDRTPSLSINEGKDGRALLRCQAGCDTNDVLAALGLTMRDLFPVTSHRQSDNGSTAPKPFDWQICVEAFTAEHQERLCEWRGYSPQFVSWLREQKLVGTYEKMIAFPVHDRAGNVVAAHYRLKDGSWRYYPQGAKVRPLVVGKVSGEVHLFESQWDALALRGMFDKDAAPAVIATRGASNSISAATIPDGVAIYAWKQNDEPGEKWLAKIRETFPQVRTPVIPEQYKDFNDWTKAGLQGIDLMIAIKDAEPQQVSSEQLFNQIKDFLTRYVVFSQPEHADVIALWVMHTWVADKFDFTPYIYLHSPVMRCGKTQVHRVVEPLVKNPLRTCNISECALFREIEDSRPTLLWDEIDSIFGTRKTSEANENKRALLNAGYERGLKAIRMERRGNDFVKISFDPFCPKILAGIGRLPDTIVDRSIPILIHRRLKTQLCQKYRRRDRELAKPIHDALAVWSAGFVVAQLPKMPDGLNDRQEDVWESLFVIAESIGGNVPALVRQAACVLCDRDDDEQGYGTAQLVAIKKVVGDHGRIKSADLIKELWESESLPSRFLEDDEPNYKKIGSWLSKFIKSYGGKPSRPLDFDGEKFRGYESAELNEIFERYCPDTDTPRE